MPTYYSDSEIDLIKLKLRENSEKAMETQKNRGRKLLPRR